MSKVFPSNRTIEIPDSAESSDIEDDDGEIHVESKRTQKVTNISNPMVLQNKIGNGDCKGVSLHQQRRDTRDALTKRILSKVLPDEGAYNFDIKVEKEEPKKDSRFVKIAKFFNLWPMTLREAILTGDFNIVNRSIKYNLTKNPGAVNVYDSTGKTSLSLAVKLGLETITRLLLHEGAEPNIADEDTGRTPLIFSVKNGTLGISHMLLEKGSDINMCDFKAITPIMVACIFCDIDHVQLLCNCDQLLNIDAQDENGWTCLHYAAFAGDGDICRLLIDNGVDRSIRDAKKKKALHIARFLKNGGSIAALEEHKSTLAKGDD